jgi:itaconate CoA-transferase
VQNQREWRRLCAEVLGKPDLADDPRVADNPARLANREYLNSEINAVFSSKPRDEVRALLKKAQIAFGAVNSIADVSKHPALRKIPTDTPAGRIEVMAPPAHFVGEEIEALSVPTIGQHSEALRAEFS